MQCDGSIILHVGIDLKRLCVDKETALAWGLTYDVDSFLTARITVPPLHALELAVINHSHMDFMLVQVHPPHKALNI